MDGSNGKMVVLLERIALGVEDTNKRIDALTVEMHLGFASLGQRIDGTNERIDQTNKRIDQTNARLDNMIDFMSRYYGDHEERIRALEARVFAKSGS